MEYGFRLSADVSEPLAGELYDAARADGVLEVVLYDREVSRSEFAAAFRALPGFAVYDPENRPGGFAYLTGFEGRTARIHFCPFKAARPHLYDLAAYALKWVFTVYGLDALLGAVPVINQGACRFAEALGGERLGVVPGLCHIRRLGRHVGGVMYLFRGDDHHH